MAGLLKAGLVIGTTCVVVTEGVVALPWMKAGGATISATGPAAHKFLIKLPGQSALPADVAPEPATPPVQAGRFSVPACMGLDTGAGAVVRAVHARYAAKSFLVARPEESEEPQGQIASIHTTEALLGNCSRTAEAAAPWFVDMSLGDNEISMLASSLGCAVAIMDPEVQDSRSVAMTKCMNEPESAFVVMPSTLATDSAENVSVVADPLGAVEQTKLANLMQHHAEASVKPSLALLAARRLTTRSMRPVQLDSLFQPMDFGKADAPLVPSAVATALDSSAEWNTAELALLKVTPHGCCGPNATLNALRGAEATLKSGRVRVLMTEMNFDRNSTEEVLRIFADLEARGYRFVQLGPIDSPEVDIAEEGNYVLYKTDVPQLRQLHEKISAIRSFDERNGFKVYGDGLSLDSKGRYFDFTNTVIAIRQNVTLNRLTVKEKAKLRFKNGMWWPQDIRVSNQTTRKNQSSNATL